MIRVNGELNMRLENLYPDVIKDAISRNVPLFIPVGTMEYHSAHMPLGTDTQVAYHVLEELEKRREIIIAPPVWYGCASYAVKGPEGYSIDMDGTVLNNMMYNIYMSLLKSGYRRIFTVLAHQTETHNPTETACLDASRRVLFKYLEETRGIGWWGNNDSREFYNTMDSTDNPWNWIRVMPILPSRDFEADHAGEYETSMLWALRPELIRTEKIGTSKDWFTETAKDASYEKGLGLIERILEYWEKTLAEGDK